MTRRHLAGLAFALAALTACTAVSIIAYRHGYRDGTRTRGAPNIVRRAEAILGPGWRCEQIPRGFSSDGDEDGLVCEGLE